MALIALSRNEFAIVDEVDLNKINQFNWYCSAKGYAVCDKNGGDL